MTLPRAMGHSALGAALLLAMRGSAVGRAAPGAHEVDEHVLAWEDSCSPSTSSDCSVSWVQRGARRVQRSKERASSDQDGGTSNTEQPMDAHNDALADTLIGRKFSFAASVARPEGPKVSLPTEAAIGLSQETSASHQNSTFCDTHTGGSCRFWGCDASRGPVSCRNSQCRCKPGFCSINGVCKARDVPFRPSCEKNTGGTCNFMFGCRGWRGDVECIRGQCLCKTPSEGPEYCADDDGSCHRQVPPMVASVVAVNSDRRVFPDRQSNLRAGICFSGGGSRALSVTLGALRALESLDLMKQVDALSSVSGGTWASSIYMFANRSVEELLGSATTVNGLTMKALERKPPSLGAVATDNILSVLWGKFTVKNPHQLWIETYAEAVLQPFGLANRSQYMAPDEASVAKIIERNPQLRREQFLVPQQDRPKTYIMGGTILGPEGFSPTERSAVSLQMSPDFTGSPFYPNGQEVYYAGTDNEVLVGGGFVETFAFGGGAPYSAEDQMGAQDARMEAPAAPFSLADAVGISSAAFAAVMVQMSAFLGAATWLTGFKAREVVPIMDIWPVTSAKFPKHRPALKYEVGDGAEVDNSGMMALLQRGVPKIAVFLNTNVGLAKDLDYCGLDILKVNLKGKVSNDLLDKFGYILENKGEYLQYNKVFSPNELQPLLCEFMKKRQNGDPLVVKRDLEVQSNGKWGIQGGWRVSVIFSYLTQSERFDANLPPETLQEVRKGSGGKFANWPHFKTSRQNSRSFTSYTNEQVNLLSAFSEYSVRSNAELFKELLS